LRRPVQIPATWPAVHTIPQKPLSTNYDGHNQQGLLSTLSPKNKRYRVMNMDDLRRLLSTLSPKNLSDWLSLPTRHHACCPHYPPKTSIAPRCGLCGESLLSTLSPKNLEVSPGEFVRAMPAVHTIPQKLLMRAGCSLLSEKPAVHTIPQKLKFTALTNDRYHWPAVHTIPQKLGKRLNYGKAMKVPAVHTIPQKLLRLCRNGQ